MGLQTNIFRRGATYQWRRRMPALIQLSLRTNDPLIARRIGIIVNARSEQVFDRMTATGLSREDVQKILRRVITFELERIELRRAVASDGSAGNWQDEERHDWAAGYAFKLISQRGATGSALTEEDTQALIAGGHGPDEIRLINLHLATESQAFRQNPGEYANSRSLKVMRAALVRESFSIPELMQGRMAWYCGKSAALLTGYKGQQPFENAMDLAAVIAGQKARHIDAPAIPMAPTVPPEPAPLYDPDITALIERLMAQKRKIGISEQMIDQMTKVFRLFAEATEITDIRQIRQAHVAKLIASWICCQQAAANPLRIVSNY